MSDPWKRKEVIGDCTLYLGDCLEVLPALPKADAVVTDPPYGIGADANKRADQQHGKAAAPSKDYGSGGWDSAPPDQRLIDLVVESGSVAILWGGNYFSLPPMSGWLVWDKENGSNGYADCELAWSNIPMAVRRIKWRWAGMLQADMKNKEERFHPTQKPIEVMRWCLGHIPLSRKILDPFMGSGTTGVAAVKDGRSFVGIERDERYFNIACERIQKAYAQLDMFVISKSAQPEQLSILGDA